MTDELQDPQNQADEEIEPGLQAGADEQARHPAKAVPARKPGWLAHLGNQISNQVSRIGLPEWNLRNFLYGLAILIAVIVIWRNWVDVRLDVVVWRFDIPKSVVIIAAMLLGAGLVRAWEAYRQRQAARADEPEEE